MSASVLVNNSTSTNLVEQATQQVYGLLTAFATDNEFENKVTLAFGEGFNTEQLETLRQQWLVGDFAAFPQIEIRSSAEFNGANGAFAAATNTIYLSAEYLEENEGNLEAIADVVLEEYGHFVDAEVNVLDASGDEGDIFSALAQSVELTESELFELKAEDDTATIILDGQIIEIEQVDEVGTEQSDVLEGTTQSDSLEGKGGNDVLISNGLADEELPEAIDFLAGGSGNDIYQVGSGERTQIVDLSGNADVITFKGVNLSLSRLTPGVIGFSREDIFGGGIDTDLVIDTNRDGVADNNDLVIFNFFSIENVNEPGEGFIETIGTLDGEDILNLFRDSGDLSPLKVEGDFSLNNDNKFEATGQIKVGLESGPFPLLIIDGNAEYDQQKFTANGQVSTDISEISIPLFEGEFELDIGEITTSLSESIKQELKLAGLNVEIDNIELTENGLELQGAINLSGEISQELGLAKVDITGSDKIIINSEGISLTGVTFSSDDEFNFKIANLLEVKAQGLNVGFTSDPEEALTLQGQVEIPSFFGVDANFADPNFIRINSTEPFIDIKGVISAEDVQLTKGLWEIKRAELSIDTTEDTIQGEATVLIPTGIQIGGSLEFIDGDLNSVGLTGSNFNKGKGLPIGATGAFLQSIGANINNIAQSSPDLLTVGGDFEVTAGAKFNLNLSSWAGGEFSGSLVKLDVNGDINQERLKANGEIEILGGLLNGTGEAELNWNQGFLEAGGELKAFGDLVSINSRFRATSDLDIAMKGQATVKLPDIVPIFGGDQLGDGNFLLEFTNDEDNSNDFLAAWGTIELPDINPFDDNDEGTSFTKGFKVFFDGDFEFIDASNIEPTNSFEIQPDTEFVLLSAEWENPSSNAQVRIQDLNGNFIEEADFATNNIAIVDALTSPTSRTVVIDSPDLGIWDIELVDTTNLGEFNYFAFQDPNVVSPSLEITSLTANEDGSEVTINFNAFDADSNAQIDFYYDTDNQDLDGVLITENSENLTETDGTGSFVWNTEGVAPGDYHIYAVIADEDNPPVFSDYSQGQAEVTEAADLFVDKTINTPSVGVENDLTYTIEVTNNGPNDSKGITLTETLPEGVTFVSASSTSFTQSENTLTFDLGDLSNGSSTAIDIKVTAPTTTEVISSTTLVTSQTFDPNATNDIAILDTQVVENITTTPSEFTGENLGDIINGLDELLDNIQTLLNSEIFNSRLPLLGNTLKDATDSAVNFLTDFEDEIFNPLKQLNNSGNLTEGLIEQVLVEVLGSDGLGLLQDLNNDGKVDAEDVDVDASADEVTFDLKLGNKATFNTPLDTKVGIPGLNLETNGNLEVELGYEFNLGFGVNKDEGFFFDVSSPEELKLSLITSIDELDAVGNLGFLQLGLQDQGSQFNGEFAIDLKDPINDSSENSEDSLDKLTFSELGSVISNPEQSLDSKLSGAANINLGLDGSVADLDFLPSIGADLSLYWLFNSAEPNQSGDFGSQPIISFDKVTLDAGTFFDKFASPLLSGVQDITSLLDKVTKPLNTDLPILNQSLIELAQSPISQFITDKFFDESTQDFIDNITEVTTLVDLINSLRNENGQIDLENKIELGGFSPDFDIRDLSVNLKQYEIKEEDIQKVTNAIEQLEEIELETPELSQKTFSTVLTGNPKLTFPILEDPKAVFNLLLGKENTELFKLDLGTIGAGAGTKFTFGPIYGPIFATLTGEVGAAANLTFGYDSYGLEQFSESGDPSQIVQGFFVETSSQGNQGSIPGLPPEPEPSTVALGASIKAGAEVKAGPITAGIDAGLNGGLFLDLAEPKTRIEDLDDLSCVFDISGSLDAVVGASVKIDFGFFDYRKRIEILRQPLGDFRSGCEGSSESHGQAVNQDGELTLSVGENAENLIEIEGNTEDELIIVEHIEGTAGNEKVTVTAYGASWSYPNDEEPNNFSKIFADGGNGNDIIQLTDKVVTPAVLIGGDGDDELQGGHGNDEIKGSSGEDALFGGSGNDELQGENGDDFLTGNAGNDVINGGDGFDVVSYATASNGVEINLLSDVVQDGDGGSDTLLNIEQIEGSKNNDKIIANGTVNSLDGLEGDDFLAGGDGDDFLIGGPGADTLDGGEEFDAVSYINSPAPVFVNSESGEVFSVGGSDADGDVLISIEAIQGSIYDDSLSGNSNNNILRGESGDDTLIGGDGADELDGGGIRSSNDPEQDNPGEDWVSYETASVGVNVSLRTGNGSIGDAQGDKLEKAKDEADNDTAYNSFENLQGSNSDDGLLEGDLGDNIIKGLDGNDNLRGNGGEDTLIGGAGADQLDGGEGKDLADYSDSPDHVVVNLAQGTGLNAHAEGDTFVRFNGIATVENLLGSDFGDTLTGDNGNNEIDPGLSNGEFDSVEGGQSNDNDVLLIDYSSNDFGQGIEGGFDGEAATAGFLYRINNNSNAFLDAVLFSGIERSRIIGTIKNDNIQGGMGNDSLLPGAGDDVIYGGDGDDSILGDEGDDFLDGGDGNDAIEGNEGNDTVIGGDGNDAIKGNQGDDFLDGGDGDDLIEGNEGNDTLLGSVFGDILDGGTGQDWASYIKNDFGVAIDLTVEDQFSIDDAQLDTLRGIENVQGSTFDDDLWGNNDVNSLEGNQGDDYLEGRGGADELNGGEGNDTASYDSSSEAVNVSLKLGQIGSGGEAEGDQLSNIENLEGSFQNDTLEGDNINNELSGLDGDDSLIGNQGDDILYGGDGDDEIEGNEGDDTLIGGADSDYLDGGEGQDMASYRNSSSQVFITLANTSFGGDAEVFGGDANGDVLFSIEDLQGSFSDDTLIGNEANNYLDGYWGNDWLEGGYGNDRIEGGNGNDNLIGVNSTSNSGQSEADPLISGAGADDLLVNLTSNSGQSEADPLISGAGADDLLVISIQSEVDTLTGGAGADHFQLGDESRDYYDDLNPNSPGLNNYALITDFNPIEDVIHLSLKDCFIPYRLEATTGNLPTGTAIYRFFPDDTDELIAIVQGVGTNELDINASYFQFKTTECIIL